MYAPAISKMILLMWIPILFGQPAAPAFPTIFLLFVMLAPPRYANHVRLNPLQIHAAPWGGVGNVPKYVSQFAKMYPNWWLPGGCRGIILPQRASKLPGMELQFAELCSQVGPSYAIMCFQMVTKNAPPWAKKNQNKYAKKSSPNAKILTKHEKIRLS